eukprot:scaffold152533_cov18-Tisochrysis_lutea.AAC.2
MGGKAGGGAPGSCVVRLLPYTHHTDRHAFHSPERLIYEPVAHTDNTGKASIAYCAPEQLAGRETSTQYGPESVILAVMRLMRMLTSYW